MVIERLIMLLFITAYMAVSYSLLIYLGKKREIEVFALVWSSALNMLFIVAAFISLVRLVDK